MGLHTTIYYEGEKLEMLTSLTPLKQEATCAKEFVSWLMLLINRTFKPSKIQDLAAKKKKLIIMPHLCGHVYARVNDMKCKPETKQKIRVSEVTFMCERRKTLTWTRK
jgi:hypothetical protein